MNLELYIHTAFLRKALSIFLIVFMGIGFSLGGVLADNCQGGTDCPVCANLTHDHVPGAAADMVNPGCPLDGQGSNCGFEAGQEPEKFRAIVPTVRSYQQSYSGIFAAVTDEFGQSLFPKEFIPQFPLSDSGGTASIYLLNQALLC
jgi:hypothetical protein